MIYLDHAASTPIDASAARRLLELTEVEYANPSSLHAAARSARKAIEEAREIVATALGGAPDEIVFTSGGTESDNLAIVGAARRRLAEGRSRVVVSAIEHHAVLDAASSLADLGCEIVRAPVDAAGRLDIEALRGLVHERTALVSVMAANNETGVVQPIEAAAEIAHAAGAWFHTDAVQALPWLDCSGFDADLVSISGHKLGGPKGVGALLVRSRARVAPLLFGGGQERTRRPGTMNTASIGAFAAAIQARAANRDRIVTEVAARRDALEASIAAIGDVLVSGREATRLPGHLHACVGGVDAETLLVVLDAEGVAVSSGAACSSGAIEPSHVVRAMQVPPRYANGAIRFSLGPQTTDAEIATAAGAFARAVERLRSR